MKKIHVKYYAALREQRGVSFENVETDCATVQDLYKDLQHRYQLRLDADRLKVAVNNEYCEWNYVLRDRDNVIFLPPVNGG